MSYFILFWSRIFEKLLSGKITSCWESILKKKIILRCAGLACICVIMSYQGLRYIVLKYIAVSSLYTWYCVEYIATGSWSWVYAFIYKITKYFSLYLQDLRVFTIYSKSVLITFLFPKRIQEVSWLLPGVTRKGLFQNVYTCTSSQWQVWLFWICAEVDLWLKRI